MKGFERFEKPGAVPRFSNQRSWLNERRAPQHAALAFVLAALCVLAAPAPIAAQERTAPAPEAVHFGWADVLRVDPVYDEATGAEAQQECWEEQVLQEPAQAASPPDQGKRVGGTFLGAIVGSIIGSRFGKGDGRKAATAAGAIAGGVIGNNLAANSNANAAPPPPGPPHYTTQRRCRPIEGAGQRHVVGYDVEYRYRGEVYNARMNTDPGDRMRVKVTVTPAAD